MMVCFVLSQDPAHRYAANIPTSQLPEILEINDPVSLPQMLEEILNEKKQVNCVTVTMDLV